MPIQILSLDVVNQIAAGEVVERPAHLVKELVENSLDAQATKVQIDVAFGGKFIKISDNGIGIHKDELKLALLRHATSKINQAHDLWNLSTYGFRGEALASAAAVSKLTLMSQAQGESQGYQIKSEYGQISDVQPSSVVSGTQIIIENLFENIPARLKFLKSDSAELAQIRNVIKALALAYPHVEFKLIDNGQLDLYFKAQSISNQIGQNEISERASQVLGLKKIYTQTVQHQSFQVSAYFSSPHDVQKTSKNIWILAQKRWIQDRALHTAVVDAYRSLLMHGEYPQVVIDLRCLPDVIDVNIHPTKSQVKFQDASEAFRAVHLAVRQGLESAPWIEQRIEQRTDQPNLKTKIESELHWRADSEVKPQIKSEVSDQIRFFDYNQTQFKTKPSLISVKEQLSQLKIEPIKAVGFWSSLQVIGQLNLTYLVCQKEDRMILVDQHAAHERVAFEKLMQKWKGGAIDQQDYLFPLAIDLSQEKIEALLGRSDEILRMGIEIESLGPSVLGIKSAPLFIKESALPRVFDKMATDLVEFGGSYSLEKSIADIFATMACHSVVRAGQSLSLVEMNELLKSMDEFPLSSFCPHGRPVSIEFTFNEIEKDFGRTL